MSALAAMERSERQWRDLFEEAGLRIKEVWRYERETGDSIMVIMPMER